MPGVEILRVTVALTDEQLVAFLAQQMRALPALARARLMNALRHREPAIFAALIQRPSPAGESPFDTPR